MTNDTHDAPTDGTDETSTDAERTDEAPIDAKRIDERSTADDAGERSEHRPPGAGRNDLAPGGLNRRNWMRVLGSLALFGGAGAAGLGTAAGETADTSKTIEERIQEHRTGVLEVSVENPDGTAVEGATVSIEQQSHEFNWGTAVHADTLINQSSAGDNYREYIPELFNTTVMENQHKWALWEDNQQLADDATDWVLNQGLDMRGHVCVYGVDYAVPSDVQTAIDDGDTQTIRDRSMQHIDEIVNHYGSDIHEWEVVNEVQHSTTIFDPFTSNPTTSDIVVDWYQQAQDVRPDGVSLAINDYNGLAGNYGGEISTYQSHAQHLLDNGIDLETIGLQCHFAQNETLSTSQILQTLDEYGQLTDSLKITEYDQAGDGWAESDKAEWFDRFLRTVFSHPGVEAFLVWGFWDGRHWEDDAPFFNQDWSTKPSYDVWDSLVYGEWWTDDSGTTDGSGTYATTAFLGEQEISVSTDGDSATTATAVTDADGTTTVTVVVEGEGNGGEDDTQAPATPTNLSATDATSASVTVSWDGVTDNGTSGLDHYDVSVDGSQTQQVPAGTTMATVDGLSAGTDYEIGVSATDGAGNESDAATVTASTEEGDDGDGGDLIASIDPGTTEAGPGDLVQFWITDETPGGSWITDLEWDLGNGSADSGWYAGVRYQSAGTYTVTLTATDNDGNTSTDEVTVTIS